MYRLCSFFAGCGGLDLGFDKAGFNIIWANEFDKAIHETYRKNHKGTDLCTSDLRKVSLDEIPDCDGFIGGPPCQSWSEGGRRRGLEDPRGQLFLTYVNIIKAKQPKFFVIENVKGIIEDNHFKVFLSFLDDLERAGYTVHYKMLNAADYRIPQYRNRVFVVGFQKELNIDYHFPAPLNEPPVTLHRAIADIIESPIIYTDKVMVAENPRRNNHDVYDGPFDAKFMGRNRVRSWNEPSFTIQAQARNCPLHPQAPKMVYVSSDLRKFAPGYEHLYRRFSVRECARIQSFPDSFDFYYTNILDGYKMVGNAVPPRLAYFLALSIKQALEKASTKSSSKVLVGYYKDDEHLRLIMKNKMYYVRAGVRRGALNYPVGMEPPNFLILHHGNEFHYFALEKRFKMIDGISLKEKGFLPSGDLYITFNLICKLDDDSEGTQRLKYLTTQIKKGRAFTSPYWIDIPSI